MSLLQMVGGVAVAGVVAAGTTAFTAGGVSATGIKMIGGGTTSISVEGAQVGTAVFNNGVTASTYDRITGVTLTLSGTGGATLANSSLVSVAYTGTGATAATDGTYYACAAGSGGSWTCNIDNTTPANSYYTHIDTVDIKVAAQ